MILLTQKFYIFAVFFYCYNDIIIINSADLAALAVRSCGLEEGRNVRDINEKNDSAAAFSQATESSYETAGFFKRNWNSF